jgi:F-type H+-transporting ATPase subunit alpha
VLKQPQYMPQPFPEQVAVIFGVTRNLADDVPIAQIKSWQDELVQFLRGTYPGVLRSIGEKRVLDDELESLLEEAINAFNATWSSETEA